MRALDAKQKAHIDWVTQGAQSTTFSTKSIKTKHAKNSIMRTMDNEGN